MHTPKLVNQKKTLIFVPTCNSKSVPQKRIAMTIIDNKLKKELIWGGGGGNPLKTSRLLHFSQTRQIVTTPFFNISMYIKIHYSMIIVKTIAHSNRLTPVSRASIHHIKP
jgi:hypothetical protein